MAAQMERKKKCILALTSDKLLRDMIDAEWTA